MPPADPTRDEALRRLADRASALQTSTAKPVPGAAGHAAVGKAYQILGQLVAGPVVGLALGAGVDWLAKTTPWGLIAGVLLGFAGAVYLAKGTADRLMAQAKAEAEVNPPPMARYDDEER